MAGSFVQLVDMAARQEHSAVSREIAWKPSGTMTVFAFDEGEGLSDHTVPFDAVAYLSEGKAEIRIDGKPRWPRKEK